MCLSFHFFLKHQRKRKNLNVTFSEFSNTTGQPSFPWVELRVDLNGKVWQVRYKIYLIVEGKKKLLNPKLDYL
jgi:hypothetical protein